MSMKHVTLYVKYNKNKEYSHGHRRKVNVKWNIIIYNSKGETVHNYNDTCTCNMK